MKRADPASTEAATPPVVLLHGFTGSSESWGSFLLEGLAAGGRRVVALDLPGHGRLGRVGSARLADVVDLVEGCVDGTFDLVGYSMGGRLALHCALALPDRVRRVVLESASPGLDDEEARALRRADDAARARGLVEGGMADFARAWAAHPTLSPGPTRDPEDQARVDRVRRGQRAEGLAAALTGLGTGSLPPLWDRLPGLRQPTGLVVGALDDKFHGIARRMAASIPHPTLKVVPRAGHTVHLDRPEAWLSFVLRFLGEPSPLNERSAGPPPRPRPP